MFNYTAFHHKKYGYIRMYVYVRIHQCARLYVWVCVCTRHIWLHSLLYSQYEYIFVYICVFVCMWECVWVCRTHLITLPFVVENSGIYINVYMYVDVCARVNVCVRVHIRHVWLHYRLSLRIRVYIVCASMCVCVCNQHV